MMLIKSLDSILFVLFLLLNPLSIDRLFNDQSEWFIVSAEQGQFYHSPALRSFISSRCRSARSQSRSY